MAERGDPSLAHLLGRVGVVEARVRAAVSSRRVGDPNPEDPFRGLYLSEDHVERLLAPEDAPVPAAIDEGMLPAVEQAADAAEEAGADLRLRRIARTFGLEPLDVELLLVALAPDLDARFERLYGYLHDDVTRRRASIGLALELAGTPAAVAAARRRLTRGAPLVDSGLVLVEEPERPFLTRSLRVPDRVAMHLLGDDRIDSSIASLVAAPSMVHGVDPHALARAIRAGARLTYVRERAASSGRSLAAAAFAELGKDVIALDLARLVSNDEVATLADAAVREARLTDAGLVAGPIESLIDQGAGLVRHFAEAEWPVVLTGSKSWDPAWSN